MSSERLKSKIRALLRNARDATNKNSRDAYEDKAIELMIKHHIDDLTEHPASKVTHHTFSLGYDCTVEDRLLYDQVADGLGTIVIMWSGPGRIVVVGSDEDIAKFQTLASSLVTHCNSEFLSWYSRTNRLLSVGTLKSQFVLSYAQAIGKRIRDTFSKTDGGSQALVLAKDAKQQAEEYILHQFDVDNISHTVYDYGIAKDSGANAAQRANLRNNIE